MKPAALLLGAALLRLLWWLPPWVTFAALAVVLLLLGAEALRYRWRLKNPRPAPEVAPEDRWEECSTTKIVYPGERPGYIVCVNRKGHDGPHCADRSSLYWTT